MTILYYMTLSIYRIDRNYTHLAVFVTFATINAVYTCEYLCHPLWSLANTISATWDLLMDWSLLQPHASRRFLRDVRGYKNRYWYYGAMCLDPILRFNWIFYAIYTHDLQHSTLVSFLVAFSEVTRRGIWVLFRVENEHCSNVARFKASRDVPLPYSVPAESEEGFQRRQEVQTQPVEGASTSASSPALTRRRSHTGASLEAQESAGSSLRRRGPPLLTRTFTKILADAHTQDFEKKRKPGAGDSDNMNNMRRDGDVDEDDEPAGSSDDDDEDESDAQDVLDAELLLRRSQEESGSRAGRS